MKALVKNELRLTRKLLLIWMGIVLILCGFAYFEYLSLKESLNELTGLISNFPKILKAMFGGNGRISIYKTSGSQQGCLCQSSCLCM